MKKKKKNYPRFCLENLVKPFTVLRKTQTGIGKGGENKFCVLHSAFKTLIGLSRDVKLADIGGWTPGEKNGMKISK